MSHTAEVKTPITKVNESLLQETLELIAKVTPGLKISGTEEAFGARVQTYARGDIKCDVAIHGPGIPHGLGLRFRSGLGGLVFDVGDVDDPQVSKMQQLILLTYQTVAARAAVEDIGYKYEITSETSHSCRLEAYATA